jgi:hypothetical protein
MEKSLGRKGSAFRKIMGQTREPLPGTGGTPSSAFVPTVAATVVLPAVLARIPLWQDGGL